MTGRLPLTVISGYLGAGKTTLINHLLSEPHGQKLMVMVNDFGAINIDAALLASATEDTLTLTNGCVCCTMGADLFIAIGDVLDRANRPDHLVIEASGIADPARIAQVALAEPDLSYGGIVTVVDALQFEALSKDEQIGAQIEAQVRAADLVALSKAPSPNARLALQLSVLSGAEVVDLAQLSELAPLVLGQADGTVPEPHAVHPAYLAWQSQHPVSATREKLDAHLRNRPEGLFRFKGFVSHDDVSSWEVHVVGTAIDIKPLASRHASQVVGIGLATRISAEEIEAWWSGL